MTLNNDTQSIEPEPIAQPRSQLRRFGCGLMLIFWLVVMLLPCGLFVLAFNNQITINHANIPDPSSHPLVQLQLVMEPDNRGLRITSSQPQEVSDDALCVQTTVNYLLWQSDETDSQDITFCECYERENSGADWSYVNQYSGTCNEAE